MFRSRLLWRLYVGYVVIIVFCTLLVGGLISRQIAQNTMEQIHDSLAVRSALLVQVAAPALVAGHYPKLQQTITQLGKDTDSRLTIIGADGSVLADSREQPQGMDNHARRPEVVDAKNKGKGTAVRVSDTLNLQMIYMALPVIADAQLMGYVRVSLPLNVIDNRLTQLRITIFICGLIAAGLALVVGFYFAKHFSDPLRRMIQAAQAISQGDYNRRIRIRQSDEMGKLADAFNRMAKTCAERVIDITTERDRLEKILTGMAEGVIGVDEQQNIVHINQAAATLLGVSKEACIGKRIWGHIRIDEITQALEQALSSHAVVRTRMHMASIGSECIVDIYVAALGTRVDEVAGAVIVLNDISELDRLERVRRDFVANASHELKTPITAIRGFTETLLDDHSMEEDVRQRFIEKIHEQNLRLSALVTDLITLSRLESDHSQRLHCFDLLEVVNQSVTCVSTICREEQLALTVESPDKPILIDADKQLIGQMIDNLIGNAIKYTPAGGSIVVHIEHDDAHVVLTVSDTGIGIGPEHQQRVFERFYRIDKARSRQLGGTGLGLSIVKNIVEQHGGHVSLHSAVGRGSVFTVTLPIKKQYGQSEESVSYNK